MGPRALSISFSNRLLLVKSQQSCRRVLSLLSEESSQRRWVANWKYLHSSQTTVLIDQCQPFRPQHLSQAIATPLSLYLRDVRLAASTTVLGHVSSQIRWWGPVPSQHWCYPSEAPRVTRISFQGSWNQSRRTVRGLGRAQWDTPPPRATLFAENRVFRTDQ